MKIAKIIITEQSIPYAKNGSWTQRLEHFFTSDYNTINYCICGETNQNMVSSTVFFKVKQYKSRIILKFFPKLRFRNYIIKIQELAQKYDHLILCVVDNIKLKNAITDYIDRKEIKKNNTVLFYSCGFSYFLEEEEQKKLLKYCDEYIFLTQSSYQFNKVRYSEFIPEITILSNPIEKEEFYPVSKIEKKNLIEQYGLEGKIIFLWLSHDREKKGLDLVLHAWEAWSYLREDVQLLVVGAKRDCQQKNVQFLGQVNSDSVTLYYQMTHVYLFPTLWKEGFGLSLAQAICCGCYCIAADNGGVSDFLLETDGVLINNPNTVSDWVKAMENAVIAIQSGWSNTSAGKQILNYKQWETQFAAIFKKWENRINK